MVKQPLAFDQISEFLGIPLEDVTFLNPMFKAGIIPAYDGKEYSLRLPNDYIDKFIDGEVALYNSKSKSGMDKEKVLAEAKKASERSVHVVRSGESLGLIAKKNHVTVAQLKQWNNLRSNTIYPGQRLTIYPSPQYANAPSTTATYSKAEPSRQTGSAPAETASSETDQKPAANGDAPRILVPAYHYVKSGENLALIAKKYGCSVEDIRAWNNIKGNTIYPKQKLKVGEKQEAEPAQKTVEVNGTGGIKYVYHTVKKGDTLWGISQQYKGTSIEEIRKLNDMGSSSRLQVGQKLKIAIDG
jgi:membrane-bound lytic murein transglycosylase D